MPINRNKTNSTRVPATLHIPRGWASTKPIKDAAIDLDSRRAGLDATEGTSKTDAALLFALTDDGRAFGWNSTSGECTHETRPCLPGERISCVQLYSSGGENRLFCGTEHGKCRVLDLNTSECVTVFKTRSSLSRSSRPSQSPENNLGNLTVLSVCGNTMGSGNDSGDMCVWDVETGRLRRRWASHSGFEIKAISFEHQSNSAVPQTVLFSCGADKSVRVWDIRMRKPQVHSFTSHRNTPLDVAVADSILYSCSAAGSTHYASKLDQMIVKKSAKSSVSEIHHLPSLGQFRARKLPSMSKIIKETLSRKALINPKKQSYSHPLQRSVLAGVPLSLNGLRPGGEMLLVHDLRSKNVLRELNLVDSPTNLDSINKCQIICSPKHGRKLLILAGQKGKSEALSDKALSGIVPDKLDTAICCVGLDTGEMLFDLKLPRMELPTHFSGPLCSALSCTRSDSKSTSIVVGCSTGAVVGWNLHFLNPIGTNAVWRQQQLKQVFANQQDSDSDTECAKAKEEGNREERLRQYLSEIIEVTSTLPQDVNKAHLSDAKWGWGRWKSTLEKIVSLGTSAIHMCQHNRSFLTGMELSLGVRAATAAGMIRDACGLLHMHIRTGIGISDEIIGTLIDRLPYDCYFGRGKESVPQIEPLESISGDAAIFIAKQCLKYLRASGRIPREKSLGAYVRLLARCDKVDLSKDELKRMRQLGLKPGRKEYETLLRALLKMGMNGEGPNSRRDMTILVEEMMHYNVNVTPTEFALLAQSNMTEDRFEQSLHWVEKMISAGADSSTVHEFCSSIIRSVLLAYQEKRRVPSVLTSNLKSASTGMLQIITRKELFSFVTRVSNCIKDLQYLYINALIQIEKEAKAVKVLHSMTPLNKPISEDDANTLLNYVGATTTCPQPETCIAFFNHLCQVAPSVVKGRLHGNYMGCLLSAGRVDLALKHYTKLENDEKNQGAELPAVVYNALLASFRASEDLTGLRNTWRRMRKSGTLDKHSYELMMKHHVQEGNPQKAQDLFDEIMQGKSPSDTRITLSDSIICITLEIQTCLSALKDLHLTLTSLDGELMKTSTGVCGAAIKTATKFAMESSNKLQYTGRHAAIAWATELFLDHAKRNQRPRDGDSATLASNNVKYRAEGNFLAIVKDLVFALCHKSIRDPVLAESVVSALENPPDSCYGCLIDCMLMSGKHNRADAIVTSLLSQHLPVQDKKKKMRTRAMSASIIQEEERKAFERVQSMRDAANKPNSVVANVVAGLAHGGRPESALRVVKRCLSRGFTLPHEKVWHSILQSSLGNAELGLECWRLLEASDFKPKSRTWTALVRTKSQNAAGALAALEVLNKMKRERFVVSQDVCSAILEVCVAGGDSDGTSKMLRMMQTRSMQIDSEVFNRMIQKAVQDRTAAALDQGMDILHFARTSGVRPNLRSCKAIMKCTAKLGDATTAIMLMSQIQDSAEVSRKKEERRNKNKKLRDTSSDNCVHVDSDLCLSYVKSLCRGMEVGTALDFVKSRMCAEGSGLVAGAAVWSSLLEGAAKSHDLGRAEEVMSEMGKRGLKPTAVGKSALVSLFSRFNKVRRALAVIRRDKLPSSGGFESVPEDVEWPGKTGAASLLGAICRSLDRSVHQVETLTSMEHLASILRSSSQEGRKSHKWMVNYARQPPHCVPGKLAALREQASRREPKWMPIVEELESLMGTS